MSNKTKYIILACLFSITVGCGNNKQKDIVSNKKTNKTLLDSLHSDTVLKVSFKEEDFPSEYLREKLKPIRENFKRINSIAKWTSTEKKDIWETTEGGYATFYYSPGELEKIVTRYFGETFQILIEYYLLNGQLSFVFEKSYKYNRPIYYDSLSMKENKDNQIFDFDQSEIIEDRNYFENGKLIHQISNQDCGSPFSDDYLLEEQKRIKTDFIKLMKLKQ